MGGSHFAKVAYTQWTPIEIDAGTVCGRVHKGPDFERFPRIDLGGFRRNKNPGDPLASRVDGGCGLGLRPVEAIQREIRGCVS